MSNVNDNLIPPEDIARFLAELSAEEDDVDDNSYEVQLSDSEDDDRDYCVESFPNDDNNEQSDILSGTPIVNAIKCLYDAENPVQANIVETGPAFRELATSSHDPSAYQDENTTENSLHQISKGCKRKRERQGKQGKREDPRKKKIPEELKPQPETNYILTVDRDSMSGKDGYKWQTKSTEGVIPRKSASKNIVHIRPGPTPETQYTDDPLKCFLFFISPEIIAKIVTFTNAKIRSVRENYKNKLSSNLKDTDVCEIRALLGLLVLSAALKDNHLSSNVLYDTTLTGNTYKATMSNFRFDFLIECLRFDDTTTRKERLATDKLAAISEIWEMMLANCKKYYKPGSYLTIDEQLIGFRGRCGFKMYIPSKPNKYGIKNVVLCESNTSYMIDAEIYTGKGSTPPNIPAADYYVEKLVESVKGSNRNVTLDNWFTSVPLATKLLDKKLTVVGTIRKNKRELPPEFVDCSFSGRKANSSFFLYDKNITLVSYKPKKNKIVTLLSTMHSNGTVNNLSGKPEIVMVYNETKAGVDTLDQMCKTMSCSRKTRRCPLAVFYNMINLALVNAYVIYVSNFYRNNGCDKKPLSRFEFVKILHFQLVKEWQVKRLNTPTIPNGIRHILEETHGERASGSIVAGAPDQQNRTRRTCSFCDYKKKRMTAVKCVKCEVPICGEHQKKLCFKC